MSLFCMFNFNGFYFPFALQILFLIHLFGVFSLTQVIGILGHPFIFPSDLLSNIIFCIVHHQLFARTEFKQVQKKKTNLSYCNQYEQCLMRILVNNSEMFQNQFGFTSTSTWVNMQQSFQYDHNNALQFDCLATSQNLITVYCQFCIQIILPIFVNVNFDWQHIFHHHHNPLAYPPLSVFINSRHPKPFLIKIGPLKFHIHPLTGLNRLKQTQDPVTQTINSADVSIRLYLRAANFRGGKP